MLVQRGDVVILAVAENLNPEETEVLAGAVEAVIGDGVRVETLDILKPGSTPQVLLVHRP